MVRTENPPAQAINTGPPARPLWDCRVPRRHSREQGETKLTRVVCLFTHVLNSIRLERVHFYRWVTSYPKAGEDIPGEAIPVDGRTVSVMRREIDGITGELLPLLAEFGPMDSPVSS